MNDRCLQFCTKWITTNTFTQVGLEFASKYIDQSVSICETLKNYIGFHPYILYDPNRACGNCCVDVRTARPRGLEAIIHFGSTCLSPTDSFPVLYVLNDSIKLDVLWIENKIKNKFQPDHELVLFYDIVYLPNIEELHKVLKSSFPNLILSTFQVPKSSTIVYLDTFNEIKRITSEDTAPVDPLFNCININSRAIKCPKLKEINSYNFIYVGENSTSLVSLQMRFSDKEFLILNPAKCEAIQCNFVKNVLNRSAKIEQVRAAKSIGIITTLTDSHRKITQRIRSIIRSSDKKCYHFYMGKINEAKLGNIKGIDIFVYIGCPESSLFDRNEDTFLYKNLVTPWELEVALNKIDWSLNFDLNFANFIKDDLEEQFKPIDKLSLFNQEENYSLHENIDTLSIRDAGTLISANQSSQKFVDLTWKGLDPEQESPVSLGTVVKGKSGIAIGYESEG